MKPVQMIAAIADEGGLQRELDELDSTLQQRIGEFEQAFAACRVGVPLVSPLSIEDADGTSYRLWWMKLAGTWRLALRSDLADRPVLLADGARELRVSAAGAVAEMLDRLPELLQAKIDGRKAAIVKICNATRTVARLRARAEDQARVARESISPREE